MTEMDSLIITILVPCISAGAVMLGLKGKRVAMIGRIAAVASLSEVAFAACSFFFGYRSILFTIELDRTTETIFHLVLSAGFWFTSISIILIQLYLVRRR